MSVKKWRQLAEEKSAVGQQTQEIHQKFKMDKINKEFSQLSGEELFKPITKRLDEKSSATVEEEQEEKQEEKQEEEQEGPDYTTDELTKSTRLIMNSDLMPQHHHYHQYHHQVHQQYHQKNNHNYHQNHH